MTNEEISPEVARIRSVALTNSICLSSARGDVQQLRALTAQAGADVNAPGTVESGGGLHSPLFHAVAAGQAASLRVLVGSGARLFDHATTGSHQLIHLAASRGHVEVLRVLVDLGVSANTRGRGGTTALHVAARRGHVECVHALVQLGAQPNSQV